MERVLHVSVDGRLTTESLENKRASTHIQPENRSTWNGMFSTSTGKTVSLKSSPSTFIAPRPRKGICHSSLSG